MPTGSRDLRSHRAPILNYFRAKKQLSSGVVEGLRSEQQGQPTCENPTASVPSKSRKSPKGRSTTAFIRPKTSPSRSTARLHGPFSSSKRDEMALLIEMVVDLGAAIGPVNGCCWVGTGLAFGSTTGASAVCQSCVWMTSGRFPLRYMNSRPRLKKLSRECGSMKKADAVACRLRQAGRAVRRARPG